MIAIMLGMTLMVISLPADVFASQPMVNNALALQELKSVKNYYEVSKSILEESIFPADYPEFLKQVYILFRQADQLKQLSASDREDVLKSQQEELENFSRGMLKDEKLNVKRLYTFAQAQVGQNEFETFLTRFGIKFDNQEDIELEVFAQIERMRRREAYHDFTQKFNNAGLNHAIRMQLVKASTAPHELEYALCHCEEEEFRSLLDIVIAKDGFGPQTPQDKEMLDYLEDNWRVALDEGDIEAAMKWRAVIAQMVSQPVGKEHGRLPFSKEELFAMMRNAERTLEQRKRPFIDITGIAELDKESAYYAYEIIKIMGKDVIPTQKQPVIAYGFLDSELAGKLGELKQIYEDILSNKDSGQTEAILNSVRQKKELIEILDNSASKRVDTQLQEPREMLLELVQKILENRDEPYRLPFIQGIILLKGDDERLDYYFIEDFPMIVAGETYPYQWKHDNEVNIALLLANVDPYLAAQAVRFIIYHGMWRSEEAKKLGLYGWLSQIIFGDRQTGKLPMFNNKTYYYFPDFRFRPTKKIDEDNERNRTSEIMQLPFFGWTVWRVYEELNKVNEEHAHAFLKEVYPYVRANTEAIRTALDPYDEAVLSGRDAWVNGMDNAWYHLMVMDRHLPERFIPEWAMEIVENNRVDNRVDKKPGNPVDLLLAEGRPSEYYYAFKIVFYNIIKELGLDPVLVYHASPYNAKDAAITGVMARSLEAQIAMAEALKNTDADVYQMSTLRDRNNEITHSWNEEINRYQTYLDRMKEAVNRHLWSPEDKIYYNRDITQMFPGIVEQQFCRITIDKDNKIHYEPIEEYWRFESDVEGGGRYVLSQKARESLTFDAQICSVSMDLNGNVHYEYKFAPQYWKWIEGEGGSGNFQLNLQPGDPFIVEQFCHVRRDTLGSIWYEPDLKYWTWVNDEESGGHYELNERAKRFMGQGARKIEDGDLLRSPAIAGFFTLFGHIPSEQQAFQQLTQVVNPWMWWPENGIPIPTQPMMIVDTDGGYITNEVYDPDKYWLGPTWMASTKPVIDGFHSYGYEMMYLYLVQRTVGTLQDGRAVEHWRAETGEVNTSNINFPWAASCMAGSIWKELTKEEQVEYLEQFHSTRHVEAPKIIPNKLDQILRSYLPRLRSGIPETYFRPSREKHGQTLILDKENNWAIPLMEAEVLNKTLFMVPNQWIVSGDYITPQLKPAVRLISAKELSINAVI